MSQSSQMQLSMFDEVTDNVKEEKIQDIMDKINNNYSKNVIGKGSNFFK